MMARVAPGTDWAIIILARLQAERVGAFVPNPMGKVQRPCRYAVQCALDALSAPTLDDALARPELARRVNELVAAHA